jgi:hypothetical protein
VDRFSFTYKKRPERNSDQDTTIREGRVDAGESLLLNLSFFLAATAAFFMFRSS